MLLGVGWLVQQSMARVIVGSETSLTLNIFEHTVFRSPGTIRTVLGGYFGSLGRISQPSPGGSRFVWCVRMLC